MPLTIQEVDETTFNVTIANGETITRSVTVSPEYSQTLTGGVVPLEKLVEKSFESLLAREPNTSILSTFDLPVIQRYFPEYEPHHPQVAGISGG
jgi:hypothetical protein